MGYLAELTRRFFHPACADEMLNRFLPKFNGMDMNVSSSIVYQHSPAYIYPLDHSSHSILYEHLPPNIPSGMATNDDAPLEIY